MKWLKKINQLFTHKELLDNSEQPKNVEQEAVVKKPQEEAILPPSNLQQRFTMSEPLQDIVEKAQQQAETTGAFRFPLIPDNEEFTVPPPPMPERREERVQQQKQKAAEVDLLNIVLEPDPDSPGIRGVLKERKRGIHRKKEKPLAVAPIGKKKKEPVSALRAMKEDPSFEHRRFVPSVVPSPIYGYGERTATVQKPVAKEPSTINELLGKHKQQEQEQAAPPINEPRQTSVRQTVLTNKSILQTLEYAYEELPNVREARLAKDQPEVVEANDYVEPASPELMMHPDVLEQDIIRMPSLHNAAPKQQDEEKPKSDEAESVVESTEAKVESEEAVVEATVEPKFESEAAVVEATVEPKAESEEATDETKIPSEETVAELKENQPVAAESTDEPVSTEPLTTQQPEVDEVVQQTVDKSSFEGEIIEEERLDQPVLSPPNEQQPENADALFEAVCRFVYESQSASITAIKRQFRLNSSEAAPIVEKLEAHGYISEPKKGNRRDVLITQDELDRKFS